MTSAIAAPWSRIETSIGSPRRSLRRSAVMLSNIGTPLERAEKGRERCRGESTCQRPETIRQRYESDRPGLAQPYVPRRTPRSDRHLRPQKPPPDLESLSHAQ